MRVLIVLENGEVISRTHAKKIAVIKNKVVSIEYGGKLETWPLNEITVTDIESI